MVKFVIGKPKEEEQEPTLHAWLAVDSDGNLRLIGSDGANGLPYLIAYIDHISGKLNLVKKCHMESISIDDNGCIKVAGYKRINDD